MTTAAAKPTTSIDSARLPEERGWKDEQGPEFIKFEHPGDTVTGKLVEVQSVKMSGKDVNQYTVEVDSGKRMKFNGTFSIQEKLNKFHVGKLIRVRYLGDDVALGTQANPLRLFQVQTKDAPVMEAKDDIGI